MKGFLNMFDDPWRVRRFWGVFLAAALFCTLTFVNEGFSQKRSAKAQTEQVAKNGNAQEAEGTELTAWNIIEMTSWLFWPFVVLTGAGIMLISFKSLQEYQQKARAQSLLQGKITVNDLKGLVRQVQESKPNRASQLLYAMIATFNKTNNAEPIGDDAEAYLNTERERYETFNRVMGFLSDSAGALGLLGTVWGIFETFHGGKLDGPTILQGMSVSLVTTLVGLIISLALNAGTTAVFALFNGQISLLSTRAEELRQALMQLKSNGSQQPSQAQSQPRSRAKSSPNASNMSSEEYARRMSAMREGAFRPSETARRRASEMEETIESGRPAFEPETNGSSNGWL